MIQQVDVDVEAATRKARSSMARSLLFYLVVGVACAIAAAYIYSLPPGGFGWVSLAIAAVLAGLCFWQVWQFGRDLQSRIVETEGVLTRKWQRAELFIVWQSFFILVNRRVFKVEPDAWVFLELEKPLRVRHFPRTMTVVAIENVVVT